MSRIKVALLFGGKSKEHSISVMSARAVVEAVDQEKYEVIPIGITADGKMLNSRKSSYILNNNLSEVIDNKNISIKESLRNFLTLEIDIVFPILHGPYGEDGRLQGFLETAGIPYVGSGVLGSGLGMDKGIMKEIFAFHHLPQANFKLIDHADYSRQGIKSVEKEVASLGYPCFIKPANMGSSIGISMVRAKDRLKEAVEKAFLYDRKIVIEEYIKGREVECSVLEENGLKASLPGEIKAGHEFYDFDAKYKEKTTDLIIPAQLDEMMIEQIQTVSRKAFQILNLNGFARIDFFIREIDQQLLINEVNTIPGFTPYSMYPKLWEVTGISYAKLIDLLIEGALQNK